MTPYQPPFSRQRFFTNALILFVLLVSACDIDDFGKAVISENRGKQIVALDYVEKLFWYGNDHVLALGGGLRLFNVNNNQVELISGEYLVALAGITANGEAIVMKTNNVTYQYELWAISLVTKEWSLLSESILPGSVTQPNVQIQHNFVGFTEIINPNFYATEIFLYDAESHERISTGISNSWLRGISPDGADLLYTWNDQAFTYNREGGTHTPLPNEPKWRHAMYWNDDGIVSLGPISYIEDQAIGEIPVWNEANPNTKWYLIFENINSLNIAADGTWLTYAKLRCANPYYVTDCYGEPFLVSLHLVTVATGAQKEIVHYTTQDPAALDSERLTGTVSPDRSKFAFTSGQGIYVQSLNP